MDSSGLQTDTRTDSSKDIRFRQNLACRILGRQYRRAIHWPLNPNGRVTPQQAALMLGVPVVRRLIEKLRRLAGDHLPLYRQEAIFGRAGVETARSTGAQLMGSCGVELQPLVDALKRDILGRRVVHAD
jgi:transposase